MRDGVPTASDYLLYQIVNQSERRFNKKLSKTELFKIAYICDQKLLRHKNIETGLPVFWYQFGPMVQVEEESPIHFIEADWDSEAEMAVLEEKLPENYFEQLNGDKRKIYEVSREVSGKFGESFGSAESTDHAYNNFVPTESIKRFDDLRAKYNNYSDYDDHSLADFGGSDSRSETLHAKLDDLLVSFPKDRYDFMYEDFLDWESVSRQLIKNNLFDRLKSFSDRFWLFFSRCELRLHHNRNIPSEDITKWIHDRNGNRSEAQRLINQQREQMLIEREPTKVLESVAPEYNAAVQKTYRDLTRSDEVPHE